jgi:hypothetical protein
LSALFNVFALELSKLVSDLRRKIRSDRAKALVAKVPGKVLVVKQDPLVVSCWLWRS